MAFHDGRLLLDETISATVASQLRDRGYDVVVVQDPARTHLRGINDCELLDRASRERRAVVTDNIPNFVRCHHRRLEHGQPHDGLLLFTNDTFPRQRDDPFIGQVLAVLVHHLQAHPHDDYSSCFRWLQGARRHPGATARRRNRGSRSRQAAATLRHSRLRKAVATSASSL